MTQAPGNLYTNPKFWREDDGVIAPTPGALADLLELNAEQDDTLNLILRKESGSDGPFYWNGKGFTWGVRR